MFKLLIDRLFVFVKDDTSLAELLTRAEGSVRALYVYEVRGTIALALSLSQLSFSYTLLSLFLLFVSVLSQSVAGVFVVFVFIFGFYIFCLFELFEGFKGPWLSLLILSTFLLFLYLDMHYSLIYFYFTFIKVR